MEAASYCSACTLALSMCPSFLPMGGALTFPAMALLGMQACLSALWLRSSQALGCVLSSFALRSPCAADMGLAAVLAFSPVALLLRAAYGFPCHGRVYDIACHGHSGARFAPCAVHAILAMDGGNWSAVAISHQSLRLTWHVFTMPSRCHTCVRFLSTVLRVWAYGALPRVTLHTLVHPCRSWTSMSKGRA